MLKKGVKIVFKRKGSVLYGEIPQLDHVDLDIFHRVRQLMEIKAYVGGNIIPDSVRMVVNNKVYEMHTDKHNNVIFRCYEKT